MKIEFAERMRNITGSEIRESMKLSLLPGMITFSGGLPAPELFPVEEMKIAAMQVLDEAGAMAMQYSTTEGFDPLREQIVIRMKKKYGIETTKEHILITNGSQQGLDFSGRLFLNKGDIVLFESPSYMGAFNAFKTYEPIFKEVPTDEDGMIPEELDRILMENPNAKMIYVIPDFQNPTGRTWSLERRKAFLNTVKKYNIPVIEDNPYGELRYENRALPSLKALDTEGQVIFLGSFSKILAPGYRIGWICAETDILQKYIFVKQGADLQPSTISQMEISKYLELYDLDVHVEEVKNVYKRRCNLMYDTMKEYFPPTVKFKKPSGGLFMWVELPPEINASVLMRKCAEERVIYIPGASFYANDPQLNTFRLNFSSMPDELIVEGIKRMASVLQKELEKEI